MKILTVHKLLCGEYTSGRISILWVFFYRILSQVGKNEQKLNVHYLDQWEYFIKVKLNEHTKTT